MTYDDFISKRSHFSFTLIKVDWVDSRQPTQEWVFFSGYKPQLVCSCISVGWVVFANIETLVVAQSMACIDDASQHQINGCLTIAGAAVTNIEVLND